MSEIGDIYQVRIEYQDRRLESMLNVFYFRQVEGGTVTAGAVASTFLSDIWVTFRAAQPEETTTKKITVVNGMNNLDAYEGFLDLDGTNPSTAYIASFIAAGFRHPRPTPGFRHAYHRVGGLAGQFTTTYGDWNSTMEALLRAIAVELGLGMAPAEVSLAPVQVVGGFKLGVPPVWGRDLYGDWQYDLIPTSQNTRKRYDWVTLP